jgi:hypothetical protein
VLIPFQQYVNTQPIFGLAAGTVKFDTFHSGNQTLIQNPIPGANPPWQYNWDIDLQFLFNGAGWNKMLTPAGTHIGTFQNVYYNDGTFSHQPFPTTDLNVLLQMPALTNPWVPPPPVNSINYQQPPGI